MPKTTTLADKEALLAKMERDRQALDIPMPRRVPLGRAGGAWARTAALAAGATLGWPRFLRQPLRAMAAVAMRDRFAELMGRMQVRRVSDPMSAPELARLEKMMAEVRAAAARSADDAEIERLRAQLDLQVARLRKLRVQQSRPAHEIPPAHDVQHAQFIPPTQLAQRTGQTPPVPTAPAGRDVSAIP